MPLILSAQFLSVEHRSGDFEPRDRPGQHIAYDFHQAQFLDGSTVRKVRLPKGATVLPFEMGEDVQLPVRLSDDGTRMFIGNDDYAALMASTAGELRAAG